ncbi:shikimate dehydrogenase [Sphingomonas gilva]|uniref:Shikimate dehydrogenase (NADP(+)) n=1 Tax=Sphingomonas gilva TaxID=2305907 RepID=A0A396RTG0_9SPHN|nr:shikimate dehydrogenase [Sphingomonas gilva]RHW17653.1 shikimate dehydrogenase [Sphingomonas gilva]
MSKAYAEVIGDPIAHSKSPLIHRFWLDAMGIEGDYRATQVTREGLADFIARRRDDPAWRGCNVTLPHKVAVMEHVADPGDIRGTIGAMNTIVRQDGGLIGTNTDAAGFYAPIADMDLSGKTVAVIGAGGAARAVLFALKKAGVAKVTLRCRQPLKGMVLIHKMGLEGDVKALDVPIQPVALLVNASPLGQIGQPPLEIDIFQLPSSATVYDLVYNPVTTPLIAKAEEFGLETVDGLDMLVGQAAAAFELFFGKPPPRDRDGELRELLMA